MAASNRPGKYSSVRLCTGSAGLLDTIAVLIPRARSARKTSHTPGYGPVFILAWVSYHAL